MSLQIDQTNQYINDLINQYRAENTFLKKYIERINTEIRKHLNIQIPSLDEGFTSLTSMKGEEFPTLDQNVLNEWLNRLINVEYINPLLGLYDTHIQNLENELIYTKNILKNYDSKISDLINENNSLRQALEIRNNEFKSFLEIKVNDPNEGDVVMDREYVLKLEDRCNLLSKENDILAENYMNLQKDNFNFKQEANNTLQNNIDKISAYDDLYQNYVTLKNNYDALFEKNQINELKMFEFADKANKLENENENIKNKIDGQNKTILDLNSKTEFYKNLVEKMNNK
jgi:hypothetical protein